MRREAPHFLVGLLPCTCSGLAGFLLVFTVATSSSAFHFSRGFRQARLGCRRLGGSGGSSLVLDRGTSLSNSSQVERWTAPELLGNTFLVLRGDLAHWLFQAENFSSKLEHSEKVGSIFFSFDHHDPPSSRRFPREHQRTIRTILSLLRYNINHILQLRRPTRFFGQPKLGVHRFTLRLLGCICAHSVDFIHFAYDRTKPIWLFIPCCSLSRRHSARPRLHTCVQSPNFPIRDSELIFGAASFVLLLDSSRLLEQPSNRALLSYPFHPVHRDRHPICRGAPFPPPAQCSFRQF